MLTVHQDIDKKQIELTILDNQTGKLVERECKECGKKYFPNSGAQKYCYESCKKRISKNITGNTPNYSAKDTLYITRNT